MRRFLDLLLSLKTAFGLFLASIAVSVIGSLMLPANLAFFSGIDDTPLFRWLSEAGDPGLTWWIYLLVAVMGVLALSTVLCTADALLKGVGGRNMVLKLSPQVMHIGVLLVLFGHLLSSSIGTKADLSLKVGEGGELDNAITLSLKDVEVAEGGTGSSTDWKAEVLIYEKGKEAAREVLMPAHPAGFGGYGLFIKSVNMQGEKPSALIRVCRDPGALWALLGGILVFAGGLGYLYGRAAL